MGILLSSRLVLCNGSTSRKFVVKASGFVLVEFIGRFEYDPDNKERQFSGKILGLCSQFSSFYNRMGVGLYFELVQTHSIHFFNLGRLETKPS